MDSTNSEGLRWAQDPLNPAPEGAAVVADEQTAGRGRWGRSWFSAPGMSLTFSVVLRPQLSLGRLDLLTTTVGVAVVEAVREVSGVDALLKWPNDVVLGDRKLAGILVESVSGAGKLVAVVAGIGVNLSSADLSVPEEIAQRFVALNDVSDDRVDGVVLLAAILSWLEPLYGSLAADPSAIIRTATERSSILGHEVELRSPTDEVITGRALRLREDGSLEVELDSGEVTAMRAGEIVRTRRV